MMSVWSTIECQRDCPKHWTKQVRVKIGGQTPYHDRPPIPTRFAREVDLTIWDTSRHPVDGGPYCPANDAVSETIASHGIWEQTETTIILDLLAQGWSEADVLKNYPGLTREDIRACLAYARERVVSEKVYPIGT